MDNFSILCSAPGKVIITGEHAVVHGKHAVATVLDRRTFVQLSHAKGDVASLRVKWDGKLEEFSWSLSELRALCGGFDLSPAEQVPPPEFLTKIQAFHKEAHSDRDHLLDMSCYVFLYLVGVFTGGRVPLCAYVVTELPVSSGLGSSAAYGTALTTALWQLTQQPPNSTGYRQGTESKEDVTIVIPDHECKKLLNKWAYEAERIIHGNPSGVDNTVSVYGGAIVFRRGHELQLLERLPPLRFLVTNTHVPRNTKKLVAGVGRLLETLPTVIPPLLDACDHISLTLVELFKSFQGNVEELCQKIGTLFDINQHILSAIGVGHESIDSVVQICLKYGVQSKLTGAGGGGCVISIIPESFDSENLKNEVSKLGFTTFVTQVGKHGALIHRDTNLDDTIKSRL